MKLIYICARDVSVYESQVLALLSYMYSRGIDVTLLQGFKDEYEKKTVERKLNSYSYINVKWVHLGKNLPHKEGEKERILFDAITSIPNYQKAILHIRGAYTCYLVKKVFKQKKVFVPILFDNRGLEIEEHKYAASKGTLYQKIIHTFYRYYSAYTNKKLYASDGYPMFITSVSPLINDYLKSHYSHCSYPMFFHPNIAGSQFVYTKSGRNEIRNKMGYSENDVIAVCSTNGNAVWQRDSLTIKALVDLGIKVINLSSYDPHIKGCTTIKVRFSEMPKFLSAADIAVLWRDDTLMNNAASPSKFSEFAAMGLYVIHNDSVLVASNYIRNNKAGCIVTEIEKIPTALNLDEVKNNREKRIKCGLDSFGIDKIGESYIELYNYIKI